MTQSNDDTDIQVSIAEMQKDISYLRTQWDEVRKDYEGRLRALESSDRKWALAVIIGSAAFTLAMKYLLN